MIRPDASRDARTPIAPPATRRRYRLWRTTEIAYLRRHYPSSLPVRMIARALGRSTSSVADMARSLGLRRGSYYWTDAERELFIDLYGTMPQRKIAERLGRTLNAVHDELKKLRRAGVLT
jgi:Mn-dependent DtxR family transcriptional regulator